MGRAVGADAHGHPGADVAPQILERLAVAGERRRAMGHRDAAVGEQVEIVSARVSSTDQGPGGVVVSAGFASVEGTE